MDSDPQPCTRKCTKSELFLHLADQGNMSDDERDKRDNDLKCFIGGLSWQMKEQDLKDGENASRWAHMDDA